MNKIEDDPERLPISNSGLHMHRPTPWAHMCEHLYTDTCTSTQNMGKRCYDDYRQSICFSLCLHHKPWSAGKWVHRGSFDML